MHPRSIILAVMILGISHAQPTSRCQEEQDITCSQIQASRERDSIVQTLERSMASIISRLDSIEQTARSQIQASRERDSIVQTLGRSMASIISRLDSIEQTARDTENCGALDRMTRRYEDNLYMLGLHNLTWAQARERCHQCGYSLARIESEDEQHFVRTWLTDVEAGTLRDRIWIDGTDQGHEGCWVWTHPEVTSFSSGFTAWKPGQPDYGDSPELCNHLLMSDWRWNNDECYHKTIFLCRKQENGFTAGLVSLEEIRATSLCSK